MTSRQQYEREKEIFLAALERPPNEREAFVEQACAGELTLKVGSLELLALDPGAEGEPPKIPGYRVVRKIGEGGMGDVWLAEQTGEIIRPVALKLIKQGMDNSREVARFEHERQTLAAMQHQNIASVFEAGTTPDGRPYVAMEYIAGMPITAYCDQSDLTIGERLRLFQHVCQGVAYAHQNAIIHRDLKPSNILVTIEGEQVVPKIIDFGIAKAIAPQTENTEVTLRGQLVGTPAYMSPEQAESAPDIDTRTDVYSLGAILYELVVGVPPFETAEVDISELGRLLRALEPVKPSARLQSLKDPENIVTNRDTTLGNLVRRLQGDLGMVVMKAIEKDRERRYASPTDLARDIQRHLDHEPVTACLPSWRYRAGRFIRRHTLAVAAAASLTVTLITGILGTYTGMAQAQRAEAKAHAEATTAQRVTEFLENAFSASDPDVAAPNTITARELLDEGVKGISGLDDEPAVQAALLGTMGRIYRKLGQYETAQQLLQRSVAIRENLATDRRSDYQDIKLAEGLNNLANAYAGHGQIAKAESLGRRAVQILKQVPPDVPGRTRRYAIALFSLAETHRNQGRYAEAESFAKEAISLFEELGYNKGVAAVSNTLGLIWWRLGNLQHAEAAYRRAINLWEAEDAQRLVAKGFYNLAILYKEELCLADAETYLARALDIRQGILDPTHPEIAEIDHSMAGVHLRRDEYEEAQARYERALAIREAVYDENNPKIATTVNNLGDAFFYQGKLGEAEACFERAQRIWEHNGHPNVAFSLHGLGNVLRERRDFSEAERLYQEALRIRQEVEGEDHAYVGDILEDYAILLEELGQGDEAVELTMRVEAIRELRTTAKLPCAQSK